MIELYPHQLDMVERSRTTGKRSVLIQAPTGSGKSIIASYIVQSALARKSRTIFSVPRLELLNQMSKNYSDFNIPHTFIAAGEDYHKAEHNIIASLPSLHSRLKRIEPPNLLIIDEAHFGDKALDDVITWGKCAGAFVLGLSATPWKSNGKGLGCWYDSMVEGPSIRWLIDNNYLSDYRAFSPDTPDMSMLRARGDDFTAESKAAWAETNRKIVGSAVNTYKQYAMGKRGITFTVSRAESEKICWAYNQAGVPASVIDGDTHKDDRRRLSRALATGELLQLVCAELLVFGYDLAAAAGMTVTVQCISDVQPTKSLAKQMQKWGRALRFEGMGADPHFIFDHAGNINNDLGVPCDDRIWTLDDRERKEGGKKGDDDLEIQARICPKCHYADKPKPVCKNCGYEFPIQSREIKQVEGELKEIENLQRRNKRIEVGMAKTSDDLWRIAKERGYAKGWVYRQMKIKGIV